MFDNAKAKPLGRKPCLTPTSLDMQLLHSMLFHCQSAINQDFMFSYLPIHFFLSTQSISLQKAMGKKGWKEAKDQKI